MKTMNPHTFRDGDRLHPKFVNQNFRQIERDIADQTDRRYSHSQMLIEFGPIVHADTSEQLTFECFVPNVGEIELTSAEVFMWDAADDVEYTLGCEIDGIEQADFVGVNVVADGSGLTDFGYGAQSFVVPVPAQSKLAFILARQSGSGDSLGIKAKVSFRYDRFQGQISKTYEPPEFDASTTDKVSLLNDAFDQVQVDLDDEATKLSALRCSVVNFIATDIVGAFARTAHLPAIGGRVESMDLVAVNTGAATATFTATINGALALTKVVTTTAGVLHSSLWNVVQVDQDDSDPLDYNNDMVLTAQVSAGTTSRLYAVVWWSDTDA